MTLRARLALLTAAAVALAVLGASIAAWLLIRAALMDEVDQRLLDRLPYLEQIAENTSANQAATGPALFLLQGEPIGVQYVTPAGAVQYRLPPGGVFGLDADERRLLAGETDQPQLRTVELGGRSLRVMTAALDNGAVLRLMQPLNTVERAMDRIAWLLAGIAGAGVAGAAGLGWLVARSGLRPVDRLARSAERVATTKDLRHRIDVTANRRDEVVRLAGSVNAMLAALDSARTEQRQLIENAAHELRTPLATLRNDLGVLRRAEQRPERVLTVADRAGLLADLESEAEALSNLVGELVDLARGGAEPEPFLETDLRALVDRAAASTRRVDPRVAVVVRGKRFEAMVRPAMLERAVANLIRNAVQVSRDGDRVEVDLSEVDGWATVEVADRGPGIADHDLPRLFDRFYRGADARERHGSGLGLAIVAQAAEQHGGTAEGGNRPGGGAVFTLRVPRAG